MSVSVVVCLSVCTIAQKNNGSIHLTLERRKIARTSSTLGTVRSRSRSRREIVLHLPEYKLSSPVSQLWHMLGSSD